MKVPQSYKEWKQQQNQLELQQTKQLYSGPTLADASSMAKEKKKNVTFQSPTGVADSDRDLMREPHRRQSQAASPRSDFGSADARAIHTDNLRAIHRQLNVSPNFDAQPNVLYANGSHSPRSNGPHGTNGPCNAVNTGPASTSPRHADDNDAKVSLDEIYRLLTNLQRETQQHSEPPDQMNDLMQQQRKLHSPPPQPNRYDQMNIRRMPANANVAAAPEDMPTTRDLFNIVVKQQEQLMNIQKQIHMLLVHTMSGGDASANARRPQRIRDHRESPTAVEHANRPRAANPIGLMTSLEINVQHCNRNKVIKPSGCQCECNGRPKYGHTSESELSDPENGHHPNGSGPAEGTVDADWMFYGNVLNQVNEVLEKTSPTTNRSPIGAQPLMHADQPVALARDTTAATDTNNERPNFCSAKVKQFGFQFDDVNISAKAKR